MVKKRTNQSGMTLVEGLVALLICSAVMFFAIPSFHNTFQIVNSFERKGKCERVFNSLFSAIEKTPPEYRTDSLGRPVRGYFRPKIRTSPAIVDPGQDHAFEIPNDQVIIQRFTRFGINKLYNTTQPADFSFTQADGSTGTDHIRNNGVMLYTPLLLSGPMGYLGDLYSQGFCTDYQDLPTYLLSSLGEEKNVVKAKIRVLRQNVFNKAVMPDCNKFWPRARNQMSRKEIMEPSSVLRMATYEGGAASWINDDFGFQVNLSLDIPDKDSSSGVISCETQKSFVMPMDFHNVMDYLQDFKSHTNTSTGMSSPLVTAVNYSYSPAPDRSLNEDFEDKTLTIVNDKVRKFQELNPNLQTVFTNFYVNGTQRVYDRPICSQDGTQQTQFTISFELHNITKEPGLSVLCHDKSYNWITNGRMPTSGTTHDWCLKPGHAPTTSTVRLDIPQVAGGQGWVPCEALEFCGQKPNQTKVIEMNSGTGVRYEYTYIVRNDNNMYANPNRLWGCELKFKVASVDPAGNLSYIPSRPATENVRNSPVVSGDENIQSVIREINPKVFFKPPPCYKCTCKPCKNKSMFGGFFNFLLWAVLAVATGGLAAAGYLAAAAVAGGLTVACMFGEVGCEKGSSYVAESYSQVDFVSCQKDDTPARPRTDRPNNVCNCGENCVKEVTRAPSWSENLYAHSGLPQGQDPKTCPAEVRNITTAGGSFQAVLAYKTSVGAGQTPSYDDSPVNHGDTVQWQEFDQATGRFCYATHECDNGTFRLAQENFINDANQEDSVPASGCFGLKTAHKILWNQKSDGKKPDRGDPVCKEIEFGKGAQNPSGDKLWGYADAEYECGQDTQNENTPPTFDSDPKRRFVGRAIKNQCSEPVQLSGYTGMLRSTAAFRIDDFNACVAPGGEGALRSVHSPILVVMRLFEGAHLEAGPVIPSCGFSCWAMCVPPNYAPSNPLRGQEMMYYENYIHAQHANLPFCQAEFSTLPLDNINRLPPSWDPGRFSR